MGIGKELGDDGRLGDDFILDGSAAVGVAKGGDGSALLGRRGRGVSSCIMCWLVCRRGLIVDVGIFVFLFRLTSDLPG